VSLYASLAGPQAPPLFKDQAAPSPANTRDHDDLIIATLRVGTNLNVGQGQMSVIPQIQRKRKLVDPEHADVPASKRVSVEVVNHGGDPSSSSASSSASVVAPLPPAPTTAPKAPEKPPSLKEMMRNVAKPKRGRDRAGNANGESAAVRSFVTLLPSTSPPHP
jgi:hypothetical protein